MLNDTLRDFHDLVQYAVVEVQCILFGQNLKKTFIAFVGITALFWLNKLVSPFGLALISLTVVYVAPLLNSARGREFVRDAGARTEELRTAAVNNTQKLAQDGEAKASELSSKAQDAVANVQPCAGEVAQSGKQATVDLLTQAKDKGSYASGVATDSFKELPRATNNAAKRGIDAVGVALDNTGSSTGLSDATRSMSQLTTASNMSNNNAADMMSQYLPQNVTNAANQSATQASDFASTATEKARQMAPAGKDTEDSTYTLEHIAEQLRDTSTTVPRHAEVENMGSVTRFFDSHAPVDGQGTESGVEDRPHGDFLGAPLL
ncbi:hypothetical protein B0I35DRAFT_441780 [Stachybotrys elegans]|uniref:Reticulon domain-containing protein n=1 Tax=Stachybotrys elegans TaxID=80388 RepID=A0A8K0SI68_9HYPO|nr:hypothetical protein B0I35DRAFT_441780 [Stachybotrys elegans]